MYIYHYCAIYESNTNLLDGIIEAKSKIVDMDGYRTLKKDIVDAFETMHDPNKLCVTSLSLID